ncbi:hypothetical protein HMPREF0044_0125 [Gleimia coleocanis DSM 15436]|uniref:Phage DNA packaging protein n=1 Tax=Gleimia coleocanis DSM 15436 TaxID=525245 RepID=C0VY85_9ACTO|nr:hypothetical protein [Gleimia coleocanis]EEH64388.1 hypothetical protein HMPREF0044_0125 [Gleimia coleocanis DSM 15436]
MISLETAAIKLAAYLETSVDTYLMDCCSEALEMVNNYVAGNTVPETVLQRVVVEAAAELWHRRGAPNGIKSFTDVDGGITYRIARDPLNAVRSILKPYLPLAVS